YVQRRGWQRTAGAPGQDQGEQDDDGEDQAVTHGATTGAAGAAYGTGADQSPGRTSSRASSCASGSRSPTSGSSARAGWRRAMPSSRRAPITSAVRSSALSPGRRWLLSITRIQSSTQGCSNSIEQRPWHGSPPFSTGVTVMR